MKILISLSAKKDQIRYYFQLPEKPSYNGWFIVAPTNFKVEDKFLKKGVYTYEDFAKELGLRGLNITYSDYPVEQVCVGSNILLDKKGGALIGNKTYKQTYMQKSFVDFLLQKKYLVTLEEFHGE